MTTDLELTELFKRHANDMQISGVMPRALPGQINRRRMVQAVTAMAAIAALGIGAWGLADVFTSAQKIPPAVPDTPGFEEGPPSKLDLYGTWLQVGNIRTGLLAQFNANGTFVIDDRGLLATKPAARGTFEVEGNTISFISEGSYVCDEGDTWAWRSTLTDSGRLEIVHIEEGTGLCQNPIGTEWTLVRVSPASGATLGVDLQGPAGGPAPTLQDLAGIWFPIESPGHLVQFGSDGTFFFDDAGELATLAAVRGTHRVKGDRIVFTIDGGPACEPGDEWSWQAALPQDGLLRIVHAQEAAGNCRTPRGTEWTLVRLSPPSAVSYEIAPES